MPMCPEESDSKHEPLQHRLPRICAPQIHLGVSHGSDSMIDDDNQIPQYAFGAGAFDKAEPDSPISGDEKFSAFNHSDEDDDDQPFIRCVYCEFEIKCSPMEMLHSDLVCPMCEEKIGGDTLSKLSSTTQTWGTEKSRLWVENADKFCEELATRERIDQPASDSLLPPFIRNMSIEGLINSASDISNAKSLGTDDAPEGGDEKDTEDCEEKQLRASFVQQLVPGQRVTSSVLLGSATPVSSSSFPSGSDLASVNALFCSADLIVSSSIVGEDQVLDFVPSICIDVPVNEVSVQLDKRDSRHLIKNRKTKPSKKEKKRSELIDWNNFCVDLRDVPIFANPSPASSSICCDAAISGEVPSSSIMMND
ncbi:unnamed protein product [Lupinus luteus]|uniref:Uncharacterized protein n=1 Tax=Lupinus luteus TaxID=3873 RepID=A0AAV1XFV8_LUPLU